MYAWICAEEGAACLEAGEMAKRFAAGEDREARYRAAEVYADALLRLDRALGNDAGIFFGLKEELSRVERRYRERAAAIWAPESWEALSQSRQEKALEAEE